MKKLLFFVVACLFALIWVSVQADIPRLINYQGMLTNDSGEPLDGVFDMFFRIYNAESGGDKKWEENHAMVSVNHGLFNVILGSQSGGIYLDFSEDYWLEIEVNNDTMPERLQFTSVGYAYRALVADSAAVAGAGGGGGGGWTDDGTVVRLDNGTDSVGIGNTDPSAKLDVSGDVNINSAYKIAGNRVLDVSGAQNIFVGVGAGGNNTGSYGTFVGFDAGYNNQGHRNTFLGDSAGFNCTSSYNTFLGFNAGRSNLGGNSNTSVGAYAGYSNTTGYHNTFLGKSAGLSNTTGTHNTFLGYNAGYSDTSGVGNSFLGSEAGYMHNTGDYNTFLGNAAGHRNETGSGNVFIGRQAGFWETGSNKLYIANTSEGPPLIYGDFSTGSIGLSTTSPSSETKLHVEATSDDFGILVDADGASGTEIGLHTATSQYASLAKNAYFDAGGWQRFNTSQGAYLQEVTPTGEVLFRVSGSGTNPISWTNALTIETNGEIGIGTTDPGTKLAVNGLTGTSSYNNVKVNTATGDFYFESSSKRYKEHIRPLEDDFHKIFQVEPKSFVDKASGQREIGYIAEEFDELGLDDLVIYDGEGQPNGLKYALVSLYLLELMKDQVEAITTLKAENEELKQRMEALESK